MRGLEGLIALVVVVALFQTDPGSLFLFLFLIMGFILVIGFIGYIIVGLFEGLFGGGYEDTSNSSSEPRATEMSIPYWTFERTSSKPKHAQRVIVCDEEEEAVEFPIDINKANLEKLQQIPFVGRARAMQIIDGAPYKSIEELKQLEGFGERSVRRISDFITVKGR